jgi:branched-chain amino acid aminotransferase
MATVFLNGRFTTTDEARVSAFDAGFQHGVGLFETMLAVRTKDGFRTIHAREHLERLAASALRLGLSESLRVSALEEAVRRTAEKAGEEMPDQHRLRLRLTLTGGDLNMLARTGSSSGEGVTPTLLIVAQPATEYPEEMFERGSTAVVADLRVNPLDPFQGHKTLNYWPRLRELQIAAGQRVGEALVFMVTNHLAGGCVSNAFIVKDDVVYTPIARGEEEEVAGGSLEDEEGRSGGVRGGAVLPSPVLPGIVRRWVLDWCDAEDVEVRRRMLTIDDVLKADEVFLTNSSWGVLPIVRVEQHEVGDGKVGELSRRLVDAWADLTR